ncbi:MAG: serine/threonine-protein kinase [Gemmatimonadota bacterium]|nr:serine/threonine-protein kinase [Gemmatimonadota bacterium]
MTEGREKLINALRDRYEIERELGAGGMATVYLAQDIKHDRKVAVKVLKPELAAVLGAERFVQEIKTTAALQHPHILPLFDSGEASGFLYYVMPFIDGETLREKLNRDRQLGIEEAVRITTEVADALDYAHRHNVIHRDIKPENILIHDGRPMVADFGIALAVSAAAGGRMTETGMSLGTPHYMSPEQATADKDITARSDIYSLASVLYEMLAGEPPHTGGTAQAIIMKIIAEPAQLVTELRRSVPPNVAAALATALEKVPADRFETPKAFAAAIADPHYRGPDVAHRIHAVRPWSSWVRDWRSVALLVGIAGLALVFAVRGGIRETPSRSPLLRFTIQAPIDSTFFANFPGWRALGSVVAPDQGHVAFTVIKSDGQSVLLRPLNATTVTEFSGGGPFFSASGGELGWIQPPNIMMASVTDPTPISVGPLPEVEWDIAAVVWHPDDRILIVGTRGLWSLDARGGEPALILPVDARTGEVFTRISLLSDGRILLNSESPAGFRVDVLSADATQRDRLPPQYEAASVFEDVLVFERSSILWATRFDFDRLEAKGEPVPLPELETMWIGASVAWATREGNAPLEAAWVTQSGRVEAVTGMPPELYRWPRMSPEGGRIVGGSYRTDRVRGRGIVVWSIDSGTRALLAGHSEPVWSPDGSRAYVSTGGRPFGGIMVQVADGSRPPDTLVALDRGDSWPTAASRDGRWLAYYGATLGSGTGADAEDPNDLFFLDLESLESRRVSISGAQRAARFSPDGRWVAYQSTERGGNHVIVRPWPAMDAIYQVSDEGGTEPIWSPDGRALYYRLGERVMAVSVTAEAGTFQAAPPRTLFSGNFAHDASGDQSWDLAPDGRFIMVRPVPGGRAQVEVALNWIDDVRARLDRAQ